MLMVYIKLVKLLNLISLWVILRLFYFGLLLLNFVFKYDEIFEYLILFLIDMVKMNMKYCLLKGKLVVLIE